MVGTPRPHHSLYRTCCPLPRVKPAGSVNDMALDAFDLDRMKQVSAYFPEGPGAARGRGGGWQHWSPARARPEQSIASAPRGNPSLHLGLSLQAMPEVWEAARVARVPWLGTGEGCGSAGRPGCHCRFRLTTRGGQLSCPCRLSLSLRLWSPQEILEEVVRELHKVKEEIIDGE